MAHAFNDDKSKADVYSKDDFVIIDFPSYSIPAGQYYAFSKTANELRSEYGITDVDDYAIMSVAFKAASRWMPYFTAGNYVTYPDVRLSNNGGLSVQLYNEMTAAAAFQVRVVLMKVN